jgi:Ca2+-binding RTX toxin-like protein
MDMAIRGTRHDDTLDGTSGNDVFIMNQGGNDTVSGGDGNDQFGFGGALTAADKIDGGTGDDKVVLNGDYSAGITFAADTMVNVERLQLFAGHDYSLTMNDGNVAAGERLIVNATALGASNHLTFDGSAEADGRYMVYGGAGDDMITGGAKADIFHLENGGADTAHGGAGNDTFYLGETLWSDDQIDGGAGNNTLHVSGFAGGDTLVLASTTLQHVTDFIIDGGSFMSVVTDDATVAAGATMTFDTTAVNGFVLDGSAETDGSFNVVAGSGDDTITGGSMGDTFTGNGGADTYLYTAVGQSTGLTFDTITDFAAGTDKFDLTSPVTEIFAVSGSVNSATFDSDLNTLHALQFDGATIVTVTAGDLSGHTLLVIDGNGDDIYSSGQDYVIDITHYTGTITTGDFI